MSNGDVKVIGSYMAAMENLKKSLHQYQYTEHKRHLSRKRRGWIKREDIVISRYKWG